MEELENKIQSLELELEGLKNELKKIRETRDKIINKMAIRFEYSTDSDSDSDYDDIHKVINNYMKEDEKEHKNCGCGSTPQKEDPEISNYLKKILKKYEDNDLCTCGCEGLP
jgi:uncharacterized coiled-coil DUF342 family protein